MTSASSALEYPVGLVGRTASDLAIEARMVMGDDLFVEELLFGTHCCKAWCNFIPVWYCGKCDVAYCPEHVNQCAPPIGYCGFCSTHLCLLPSTGSELAAAKAGRYTSTKAWLSVLKEIHHAQAGASSSVPVDPQS
jgi:hypothetical protein